MPYELPDNATYDEIWRFTTNILSLASTKWEGHADTQAAYYVAATHVNLAKRLDGAIGALRDQTMLAAQHVGKVTENQTRLMLDAYNRSIESTTAQGHRIERLTRSLTVATWVLAAATIGLLGATVALYLK
jgi:hypothetical protein